MNQGSNAGRLRVRTGNTDVASNQASVLIECGNNRGSRTSNRGLDVWSGGLSLFTLPNVPCSRRVAGSGDGVGDHAVGLHHATAPQHPRVDHDLRAINLEFRGLQHQLARGADRDLAVFQTNGVAAAVLDHDGRTAIAQGDALSRRRFPYLRAERYRTNPAAASRNGPRPLGNRWPAAV